MSYKCCNCEEFYGDEEDLSRIVCVTGCLNGQSNTIDMILESKFDEYSVIDEYEKNGYTDICFEVFNGCPFCLNDEFLMEVESNEV